MPLDLETIRRRLAERGGPLSWSSLEELADTPEFRELLEQELPNGADRWLDPPSRRHFLGLLAASLGLAGLAGCSPRAAPVGTIMPYVRQPEGMTLGRPLFFATAMPLSGFATGVLVESHEGRPVKIEGNPNHPSSGNDRPDDFWAATDLYTQASILGLYDPDRSRTVTYAGRPRNFDEAHDDLLNALGQLKRGKGLYVLTGASTSPTFAQQMDDLKKFYPEMSWHQYEPVNRDNVHAGAVQAFGSAKHCYYNLANADVILSLDADLLSCGPGHVRYVHDFAARRRAWRELTGQDANSPAARHRLYAAESTPTNTGAVADHRLRLRASAVEGFARALAAEVQRQLRSQGAGNQSADAGRFLAADLAAPGVEKSQTDWITAVVKDLLRSENRGRTLVAVGDHQPAAVHAIGHALNAALGNAGKTVFYTRPVEVGPDEKGPVNNAESLRGLIRAMEARQVQVLVILGCNPVYNAPADIPFTKYLSQVPRRFHLGLHPDETAFLCHWHIPEAHYLESWGDARAHDGTPCIIQPLIAPLYGGRSIHEMIEAMFPDRPDRPYYRAGLSAYELVRRYWAGQVERYGGGSFEEFWRRALAEGVIRRRDAQGQAQPDPDFAPQTAALQERWAGQGYTPRTGPGKEIIFRADPTIYDGRFANNAWLQELPKPLTKLTWDNVALMSPKTAHELKVGLAVASRGGERGQSVADVVELRHQGATISAAAYVLPGHPDDCVTVHLGYGRDRAGRIGTSSTSRPVGFNAYRLRSSQAPWFDFGLEVLKTGETYRLACTQFHHIMRPSGLDHTIAEKAIARREPARHATLEEYRKHPRFAQHLTGEHEEAPEVLSLLPAASEKPEAEHVEDPRLVPLTLYPQEKPNDRHLGYEHAANVYRWGMAIDLTACTGCSACVVACQAENNIPVVGKAEVMHGREMHWLRIDSYYVGDPANPETYFQPVACMHCEKAPCEVVCPVNATVHSGDGLNDMVYNRCVGTRYCSNNCPYKVRRFNFLQYNDFADGSLKLRSNPEVTVRSRGVMEKCSYCVQRIRNAEIAAERARQRVRDGDILTACQAACPAGAIVFGDLNDPKSEVARWKESSLNYGLLAELNTMPRTTYLAALRNPNPEIKDHG